MRAFSFGDIERERVVRKIGEVDIKEKKLQNQKYVFWSNIEFK